MALSNQPTDSALEGLRSIYGGVENAFGSHEAALQTLGFANTFLNASIGLFITTDIIAFFAYLLCWIFAKSDTELERTATRGATRSFIALFLMVNIWGIMRLIMSVVYLSPVTEYAVFFGAFFILGFWTLFSVGDGFVRLLSYALDVIFMNLEQTVRILAGRFALSRRLVLPLKTGTLRLILIVVAALAITSYTFYL